MDVFQGIDEKLRQIKGLPDPNLDETCNLFILLLKRGFHAAWPYFQESFLNQVPWDNTEQPPKIEKETRNELSELVERSRNLLEWAPDKIDMPITIDKSYRISPHYVLGRDNSSPKKRSCIVTLPISNSSKRQKQAYFSTKINCAESKISTISTIMHLPL
jgi:hypothetical protein